MFLYLYIVPLAFISFMLFLGSSQTGTSQEQYLTYSNPDYDIGMHYPSDWTPSEVNLGPYQVVRFVAPSVEEKETPTSIVVFTPATLAIAVQPLDSSNITRAQFIDQFLNFAYDSPSRYRIIETSNTTLEDMEAEQIVMYEYPEDGSTSKIMRVIALANDTAYAIKYTAEPGKYDEYLPIAQTMIDSFTTSSDVDTAKLTGSNIISSQQSDSLSVPGRENISSLINNTLEETTLPASDIILQPRPAGEETSSLPSKLIVTDVTKGDSQLPLRFFTTGTAQPTEIRTSGATTGELNDYYPVVMFHFDQPSQTGLVNIKHLLLGPVKNYESPSDILSDSRYFKDIPLNEQVLLEMDNPGLNYFIISVQFANGSQGIYSNIMDMDAIFTKATSEDQVDYRMDRGEEYNIIDDSDIDDIQSDPAFQQIASKIICSDLDNNGFQVCQQGLSADAPATGATQQTTAPPLAGTDSIFEDSDNEDQDDDDNNNDDNDNNED
jgi:PsbP-like protein